MKLNFLALLLLKIFLPIHNLNAQNWQWMKPMHEQYNFDQRSLMRTDNNGNVLIRELTTGGTDFKYVNASGQLIWHKTFDATYISDFQFSNNQLYMAGNFSGTVVVSGSTFTASGPRDGLILITDNQLNVITYKIISTPGNETFNSIAIAGNDIVWAGTFTDAFSYDNISFIATPAQNSFILKTNSSLSGMYGFQTKSSCCSGSSAVKIGISASNSVYLIANGDSYVKAGNDSIYIADEGQFLVKLSPDLQLQWINVVKSHFMYGRYHEYMEFDSQNNPIGIYREGGGGGSTRRMIITKWNGTNGSNMLQVILPMNYYGTLQSDQNYNLWAAGNYYHPTGQHLCFSVVKVSESGILTHIVQDSTVSHHIIGFALKDSNSFYLKALCRNGMLGNFNCIGSDSTFLAFFGNSSPVGIASPENGPSMTIYPNPTTSKVYVNGQAEEYHIEVYNTLGKKVKTFNGNTQKEADLADQPNGIYILKISYFGETYYKQIVVNR